MLTPTLDLIQALLGDICAILKKFGDALSSKITDITNVGGSQGSSIVAAMFLNNFVKKETPWIHLDIAGVAKNTETIFSKTEPQHGV